MKVLQQMSEVTQALLIEVLTALSLYPCKNVQLKPFAKPAYNHFYKKIKLKVFIWQQFEHQVIIIFIKENVLEYSSSCVYLNFLKKGLSQTVNPIVIYFS